MRVRLLSVLTVAIATVAALTIVSGSANATAPSGATTQLISRATFADDYSTNVDGIKAKIKGPVDVAVIHVTIQPGGTLGWHSHPGATFVMVTSGTITRVNADGCGSEAVSAGHGFYEDPNSVHVAENRSSEPAETYVTFIVPVGSPLRIDEPAPDCTP